MRSTLTIVVALIAGLFSASVAQARVQKMFWAPASAAEVDTAFPLYRELGVSTVQTELNWAAVAPTRPKQATDPEDPAYEWPKVVDRIVALAAKQKMQVAIMLLRTPGWANGERPNQWAPNNARDFADFARAAARRYPSVHLWMIWGEPVMASKFQPLIPQRNFSSSKLTAAQQRAPRAYAGLVDAAYTQLKAESSRNLVIGGMTAVTGDIRSYAWVRYMRLPNGKPPRMDLYGHNPFSAREPDLRKGPSPQGAVDFSDLSRFQTQIDRYLAKPRGKKRIRLFLSELTIPTGPDSEFNFYTTPATQARWITRAFGVAQQLDAYGLGWIHLFDGPHGGSRGGLLTADGVKKPGFTAFENAV